jgi:hypothetical protein
MQSWLLDSINALENSQIAVEDFPVVVIGQLDNAIALA